MVALRCAYILSVTPYFIASSLHSIFLIQLMTHQNIPHRISPFHEEDAPLLLRFIELEAEEVSSEKDLSHTNAPQSPNEYLPGDLVNEENLSPSAE